MNFQMFFKKYRFTIILVLLMIIAACLVSAIDFSITDEVPQIKVSLVITLLIVGLAAGLMGGWIGTGGCSIMLPILHFWLGFPPSIAVGTTLFAVIFTALSGGYGHFKQKNLDKRVALWLGGTGVLGVILGSWLFTYLSNQSVLLGFIIGIVFLLPALRMIWEGINGYRKSATGASASAPPAQAINGHPAKLSVFGVIVATLTGLVGLGGGYGLVPGLIYLFGAPVYITMGTSLAVMLPMAVIGGSIKLAQGFVFLNAALVLAVGSIIGAQIGAATRIKFNPYTLKLIFGIYFLYVAVKFIGNYLGIHVW
jgi:uncharacterized membrane protein YfcA